MSNNLGRLQREIREIQNDTLQICESTGGKLQVVVLRNDSNHYSFRIVMEGPSQTPYQDGIFEIDIEVPCDYPFRPPKFVFQTKIWHPNVCYDTGNVAFFGLNKQDWNVTWSLQSLALIIFSALADPLVDEKSVPANAAAATQYRNDPNQFRDTATFLTQVHAGVTAPVDGPVAVVRRFHEMGFDAFMAKVALDSTDWDEETAVLLLTGEV